MKKRKTNFVHEIIVLWVATGFILGCGVNSNSSSTVKGGGVPGLASVHQSISPGEAARIQNQRVIGLGAQTPGNDIDPSQRSKNDPEGIVKALYNNLSSSDPATRQTAEQTLQILASENGRFYKELKNLVDDNQNPDSWFSANNVIKYVDQANEDAAEKQFEKENALASQTPNTSDQ